MRARFPELDAGYESFYLRAVDPRAPRSIWLRHTIHRVRAEQPVGSIWVTLFDREADGPAAHKLSLPGPQPAPWVRIGESEFGDGFVRGRAGDVAAYDLAWTGDEPPLRHLPREWMYRAPLPKTKLESPRPSSLFTGSVTVGERSFELDGWRGMVGHNWGTQHAERWIWLHGVAFEDSPGTWLDLAIGRVRIGPFTTPWIANGVVAVDGTRLRLGGPGRVRGMVVRETPLSLELDVAGTGARLRMNVASPREHTVVWRYADPDSSEHQVANCSVASLDGTLERDGEPPLRLASAHGGAYELGMRETDHGLAVQPFGDP